MTAPEMVTSSRTKTEPSDTWITPVNDNDPIANDDIATTTTGGTLSSDNVLDNDTDVDLPNDVLTVDTSPVSGPTNGTLTLAADGSFTYTHDGGASTTDSFVYTITDAAVLLGTGLNFSDDDDSDNDITFGTFSFPFAGTTYTGNDVFNISSNGFVSLGGDNGSDFTPSSTEFVGNTFANIAPFWTTCFHLVPLGRTSILGGTGLSSLTRISEL